MNSKLIAATVIALSSIGATAAFADTFEVIAPNTTSTTSTATRAQVMGDLAKARADGSLQVSNEKGEFKAATAPASTANTDSAANTADIRREGVLASRARTNYSVSLPARRM